MFEREMKAAATQVNRRSFLKTASALPLTMAAAGLGLGEMNAHAAETVDAGIPEAKPIVRASKGSLLKTSINAYSFTKLLNLKMKHGKEGMDLYDLVDFCAKYNVDGFDATGYFFPEYPEKVPTDKYLNDLKLKAFESGVGISGTGVRNNFTTADATKRDADVAHIKTWVEVAARMGAPVLRVFSDTQMRAMTWKDVAPGKTYDDVQKYIADDLRQCAEHGEKYGVIIGVQNHGDFLQTAEQHLALISKVDSKWCGAIVDTGYYKTKDPYIDMQKSAPYAVNWQIKQSPFGAGNDVAIDLPRLMKIIRGSGYRGYVPIETLTAPGKESDPFQVVPAFLAQVRQAIAQSA